MDKFWEKYNLDSSEKNKFNQGCSSFYKDKTYERIEMFLKRFEVVDSELLINDEKIPKYNEVLEKIDWDIICNGTPVRFHGDLHFENVLCIEDENNPFCLLDWRQNFAGDTKVGDIYYDFAKLNHGLIISHELIHKNLFNIKANADSISFDFNRKHVLHECQEVLREYVENNNYDWNKVKNLTNLIFLNIAALHEHPYSSLLYYLGLSSLWKDNK